MGSQTVLLRCCTAAVMLLVMLLLLQHCLVTFFKRVGNLQVGRHEGSSRGHLDWVEG
jgi:hypothetical protein